jgi:hypothetical protein
MAARRDAAVVSGGLDPLLVRGRGRERVVHVRGERAVRAVDRALLGASRAPPPPSPTPPTELPKTPARSHAVEVAPTPIVGDVAARLAAVGVTPGSDLASGTSDDGDGGGDDDGSGEASPSPPGAVARELARIRAPGSTPPRPFPDFDRREMGVDAFIEPPDVIAGDGERGRLERTAAAPKARREAPAAAAEPAAAPDASSILSAVRALGTMLDGRMDKIEAAMQAHERRLRKIEASVASPSGGK